jgi:predicted patatin/cPLA2 family phospholipase
VFGDGVLPLFGFYRTVIKSNKERVIDIVKASSSLPIVCPITYVDNIPMLDGGICDSIPIIRAMAQGYKKNIVVLTRNEGYRKKTKETKALPFIYRKYPALREALSSRNSLYNSQLDLVEKLEKEGVICVIRPRKPVLVDRMEKDVDKLTALYEEGYECGKAIRNINL